MLRISPVRMLLLALIAMAQPATAAAPPLVRNGVPAAQIVIADRAPRSTRLAAEQLQELIEKISGAKLPIVTPADANETLTPIYVGESPATAQLGLSTADLEHGAYRIVSGPRWLALIGRDSDYTPVEPYAYNSDSIPALIEKWDAITGEKWGHPNWHLFKSYNRELDLWTQDETGSLHAVYGFLRDLGARWYMPGDWGEHLPVLATIPLPQVDKTVRPDFPVRYLFLYYHLYGLTSAEEVLWQLRLGLNSGSEILGNGPIGHGIALVTDRPETQAGHPQYMALLGGKRDSGRGANACLTSDELVAANVRLARAYFDHYNEPAISVMPADGFVICQCERCAAEACIDRGFEGVASDYVWSYVNRVATELYKTHPDRKVTCFAYTNYTLPPESIEHFSPNVVVGICEGRESFYDPARRAKAHKLREQWLSKVSIKQLVSYGYYLHGRPAKTWANIPVVFPRLIADDLRSVKGKSFGDFVEVYRTREQVLELATNHLNVYVTARLYWDADADVDAMLDEYFALQYGPAAEPMKAFFTFAETNWMNMRTDAQPLIQVLALLEAAKAAAPEGTMYRNRIDLISQYVEPVKQLRDRLLAGRVGIPILRVVDNPEGSITIDGQCDEPAWARQGVFGRLGDVVTGKEYLNRTLFHISLSDQAMYFFIRCEDDDMANLNISATRPGDENIWLGDNVELLIETQSHSYYQLVFNPAGVMVDADRSYAINTLWKSGVTFATTTDDKGWNVEIRIPFTNDLQHEVDPGNGVSGRMPTATYPWFLNIGRQRVRGDDRQLTIYSPSGQPHFHDRMKFANVHRK